MWQLGKCRKSRTSVKDYEFQVNDFVYAGDKLTTVNTSLNIFGYSVKGASRVEYTNDNVSKVYTKIEGEPELLAYEGLNYDTKAQFLSRWLPHRMDLWVHWSCQ